MFSLKTEKFNIFIKGKDVFFKDAFPKVCFEGSYEINNNNFAFICGNTYEIIAVNKCGESSCIKLNGSDKDFSEIPETNTFCGTVRFDNPCAACIEILSQNQLYICLKIDVYPESENFKEDFFALLGETNKIIYEHLGRRFEKYSSFERKFQALADAAYNYLNLEKHCAFRCNFAFAHTKKRFFQINQKHKLAKKCQINYRLISKESYYKRAYRLSYITEQLSNILNNKKVLLYPLADKSLPLINILKDIISRKNHIAFSQKYELPPEISNLISFIKFADGSYFNLTCFDIDELYAYWCFLKINSMLAKKYAALKSDIFITDNNLVLIDTKNRIQTCYINSHNDCEISLTYTLAADLKCIHMTFTHRNNRLLSSKTYVFLPVYTQHVSESDINRLYIFACRNASSSNSPVFVTNTVMLYFGDEVLQKENILFVPLTPHNTHDFTDFFGKMPEFYLKSVNKEAKTFEKSNNLCTLSASDLLSEEKKELFKDADFSVKDTLIAVVKTQMQFKINISGSFYYIPEQFAENAENIKFIAIYQSKSLFGKESGIRYFGKVIKTERLCRYKISEIPKNSDEIYYRFTVNRWDILDNPIKTHFFPNVSLYTNILLLKNARCFTELLLDSSSEYILYNAFFKCKAVCEETKENVFFEFLNGFINYSLKQLSIYNRRCEKLIFKTADIYSDEIHYIKYIIRFLRKE